MKHTNLLTQADRDMFDKIDKDCIAMHVCPPPKTFIELSVQDGDGVEVERYTDRAHSWVRNAYNLLINQHGFALGTTFGAGSTALKDIGGTVRALTIANYLNYVGWTTEIVGVQVGTGSNAESFESFQLQTLIASGVGAGQLLYGDDRTVRTTTYDSGTKKLTLSHPRVFNNNSGADIIVREVGLSQLIYNQGNGTLVCRDVLASPVTVPNAGQLTVTYTIEMTFPA